MPDLALYVPGINPPLRFRLLEEPEGITVQVLDKRDYWHDVVRFVPSGVLVLFTLPPELGFVTDSDGRIGIGIQKK